MALRAGNKRCATFSRNSRREVMIQRIPAFTVMLLRTLYWSCKYRPSIQPSVVPASATPCC